MKRQELLDDNEEDLRLAMDANNANLWTALPGIITAVNLELQTCSVQPAIQAIYTADNGDESNINLPLLVDVPLVFPRAGGFAITFPVAVGDECLVIFADRCIDGWWLLGQTQRQIELRMHDLSDGFALLAPTSQPKKLSSVSTTALQIRNSANTARVEITPAGDINIITDADVNVVAENVTVNATTATITADATINGTAQINGATTIVGGLTIDGIVFGSHVHPGVTPGGSSTGGPV